MIGIGKHDQQFAVPSVSPDTPEHGDDCLRQGGGDHRSVMTMPEFDRKTRYQKMAYCTTLEPNSDSVCSTVCRPIQCITGRAVHVVLVPTPRSWITACLPLRSLRITCVDRDVPIDVRVNAHLMYKVVLSWEDKADAPRRST